MSARGLANEEKSALGLALSEEGLPCPAAGLELSVVTLQVSRNPTEQPPFEIHVTTSARTRWWAGRASTVMPTS